MYISVLFSLYAREDTGTAPLSQFTQLLKLKLDERISGPMKEVTVISI